MIPVPELVRLEYQQDDGRWGHGHASMALLDPERYVRRLADRGVRGRATVLDDRLQPTGTVYTGPCPVCKGPDHNCRELL